MSYDKQKIKEKLEEEKSILNEELSGMGSKDSITSDWEAVPDKEEMMSDLNDLADKYEEFEFRSSTVDILDLRLKNVLHALGKIDTEKFGICEIGGEMIEEDRMNANPAARTCKKHMSEEKNIVF